MVLKKRVDSGSQKPARVRKELAEFRVVKRRDEHCVGLVATLPAAHCVRSLAGRLTRKGKA